MRNPENVLNTLCEHSKDSDYRFERLYRILFNEQMFYVAYQRIYAKQGNMTPGTDGKTIDQMSIQRIESVIATLRDERYKPQPARRVYIPKKNGKLRPLGIPSFEDKLVQEVVRMILEAIYEGTFLNVSHGFRPKRSCHTALAYIQKGFSGVKWFIEGDIKGFFDNIDHNVLIDILSERIADERFLRLIRKFLNAGYMEGWRYNRTYSGTPQGGIISPILANIYLDKFDKYIALYAENFKKGGGRRKRLEYTKAKGAVRRFRERIRKAETQEEKQELLKEYKALYKHLLEIPCGEPMDENYRRLKYVRYADDFLIGVIGTKKECEKIKEDITNFMSEKLKLEMSQEKTLITNAQDSAKFLGYEISVRNSSTAKRTKEGVLKRDFNGSVVLKVNKDVALKKLQRYEAIKLVEKNGKIIWKPMARTRLIHMKPEELVTLYNAEIRGFYNYYSIAYNASSVCSSFGYVMEYSLCKTLAHKVNSTVSKIKRKYTHKGDFIVPYLDSKGKTRFRVFYNEGFKRKSVNIDSTIDNEPHKVDVPFPTQAERLLSGKCELCGKESDHLVMHHVRNLKLLKGENDWERAMLRMHRKSIAVCESCNKRIQNYGK